MLARAAFSARRVAGTAFSLADSFSPFAAAWLLAGAVTVQCFTSLPSRPLTLSALALGFIVAALRHKLRWLGFLIIGIAWTVLRADAGMAARLADNLQGEDIVVTGSVRGLPRVQDEAAQFDFSLDSAQHDGIAIPFGGVIRLGWYENAPEVAACTRWQLRVRLKRPHGMINPGGFDFERYALSEGITATGYVRASADNIETGARVLCIDALRVRISQSIADAVGPSPSADLMRALSFGDQHAMDEGEWAVARATGIPHLIAISGLHIALFASFGVLLVRRIWKWFPRLTLRWPAPLIEAVASIAFAVGYALIAGLGLPTRRALVMIGMLLAANLFRRARAPTQGLAFAVIVLLIFDPLCVLSAGFWLSFVGVAWLMFCLGNAGSPRHGWREMISAQGVATIGLLPLSIWFFGQSSLIGPFANLLAVPWICFLVLPLTVLGALITQMLPAAGIPILQCAGVLMGWLWSALEWMAHLPGALWFFPEPSLLAMVFAMLGALWLLMPRGIPARALGILLFTPLLLPARSLPLDGQFDALMLDVGQGLAFVVRTRTHALVYDTGARFPSGFDLGDAAVVPALHALGITQLDRLVISHGDNDHAGGAAAVSAAFPNTFAESGEPQRLSVAASQCIAGESWNWDGVSFRIVHPSPALAANGNDRCCVLEIETGDSGIALTGDITSAVEGDVAQALMPIPKFLALQTPHHGSKSSSSEEFLNALRPEMALVSAGYRNHFNHPHPTIVARYAADSIALYDTIQSGFVHVRFDPHSPPHVLEQGRLDRHPYWRE